MNSHELGGHMDQDHGVGREIRRLREARGWSQTRLAVEADMSVSGVSMIESGHRNLTTTTLAKLAAALRVEIADLFPKGQAPLLELDAEDGAAAQSDTDVVYETVYTPDNLENAISRTFEEVQKALGDVDTKGSRLSIRHRDDGSVEVRVEPMSRRFSRVRSSKRAAFKVRRGRETA
jgi:transcriptional regulator with XRE-family HTH domain